MKAKTLVTAALLLFVGISVVYLIVGESGQNQVASEASSQAAPEENPAATAAAGETHDKVIAYYFHGSRRCDTCRTIEAYAEESLQKGFPDELKTGTLEWRVVNVENPENGHFIKDYELSTRSVIVVDVRDGEQKRWKNLTRVWELVRDKEGFFSYIQEETREFFGEEND